MSLCTCHLSISLDGYAAGPQQSLAHPMGVGGDLLHTWFLGPGEPDPVDTEMARRILSGNGAYVMGRRMFGGEGPHDHDWRGWWGEQPPYCVAGGTTFFFVTGGVDEALAQAREAAGDRDVGVAGGARTVQQFPAAGLLDELHLHIAPVLLGAGERLFCDAGAPRLEQVEALVTPAGVQLSYRVLR